MFEYNWASNAGNVFVVICIYTFSIKENYTSNFLDTL